MEFADLVAGLPSSSSHALLGGYAGAAICHHVLQTGWAAPLAPLLWSGWSKTLLFIALSPLLGYGLAFFMLRAARHFQPKNSAKSKKLFAGLQLASSALLSLSHGGNDAQKTAGIIAGLLFTAGYLPQFELPFWVLALSYTTIALGTLMGGWRIMKTMGFKLTKLQPIGGFSAESGAALSIILATALQMPVSTTLTTTGAVIGTGAADGAQKVRWPLVQRILLTWGLTLPMAGLAGAIIYGAVSLMD